MEENQRYFNILIEEELYKLYNALKDIIPETELEEKKKEIVKQFVLDYSNKKEYDKWNKEEYVFNYLNQIISRVKEIEDNER